MNKKYARLQRDLAVYLLDRLQYEYGIRPASQKQLLTNTIELWNKINKNKDEAKLVEKYIDLRIKRQ